MFDVDAAESEYETLTPRLKLLETEARFMIEAVLSELGVKIHSITSRVKSKESVVQKLTHYAESNIAEPSSLDDLVGLRVTGLFLADLPKIVSSLRETFDVVLEEDKVAGTHSESEFGYMSHHLTCQIPQSFTGPRYDGLKDLRCEVQVRTILMDAWANVSHYLDYKGESSIPAELQRDFYALSGLFYIADKHFQIFYSGSVDSQKAAVKTVGQDATLDIPLNLDTLHAYLLEKYPDRKSASRADVSEMVEELAEFNFKTLAEVDKMLKMQAPEFEKAEAKHEMLVDERFAAVGVVRVSLAQEVGEEAWLNSPQMKRKLAAWDV